MKVFLAALVLIAAGVFGMCFNILFLKKDFPQSDVGSNENMRKMGIRCVKDQEEALIGGSPAGAKKCSGNYSEACKTCTLFKTE